MHIYEVPWPLWAHIPLGWKARLEGTFRKCVEEWVLHSQDQWRWCASGNLPTDASYVSSILLLGFIFLV